MTDERMDKLIAFLDAKEKELRPKVHCRECGRLLARTIDGDLICLAYTHCNLPSIGVWDDHAKWSLLQELREEIGI